MDIDPTLKWLLGTTLCLYVIVMYAISFLAQKKVETTEDFLVAGRRLPLSLAWMTLLATWFGAGTLLTAADEVRAGGLRETALDPLGAGVCLLFAGLFVAAPMWRMQLLTVPDFFRRKFGKTAEILCALILVPSYFGWIAAQFTALAEVLDLFFGIPVSWGLLLVAVIGTGYTFVGGMWSVTLTDAVQVILLLLGLIVMAGIVLTEVGGGSMWSALDVMHKELDSDMLVLIPISTLKELTGWLGVFLVGAMGNLPGQDLMQRIFAARSSVIASRACLIAGVMYLLFGAIPVTLALASNVLFAEDQSSSILPLLAHSFLHPVVAVLFLLALLSAILSTIDSAILSPASVMSQNLFPAISIPATLNSNRMAVMIVAISSLLLSYSGQSAYELLEESYSLTLVGLCLPLLIGLYSIPHSGTAALVSMLTGSGFWALHLVMGYETFLPSLPTVGAWELPISLMCTLAGLIGYLVIEPPWKIRWQFRDVESQVQ